jgi:hypothetical protein
MHPGLQDLYDELAAEPRVKMPPRAADLFGLADQMVTALAMLQDDCLTRQEQHTVAREGKRLVDEVAKAMIVLNRAGYWRFIERLDDRLRAVRKTITSELAPGGDKH